MSMDEQHKNLLGSSPSLDRSGHIVGVPGPSRSQSYPAETYGRDYQDETPQAGLMEYWRILRRHKGTVILIAFLGLLFGVLFTLPQTPVYQARTSLEIQDMNQNFLDIKEVLPVVADGGSYAALTDIQTQIKILQSDTLIARTAQKLRSGKVEDLTAETGRIPAWRKALNLPMSSSTDQRESSLRAAAGNLKVRSAGQTRIIELLFDSTSPRLAAEFLNTLTNEYIEQNMEARWQMSQRTGDWLSRHSMTCGSSWSVAKTPCRHMPARPDFSIRETRRTSARTSCIRCRLPSPPPRRIESPGSRSGRSRAMRLRRRCPTS